MHDRIFELFNQGVACSLQADDARQQGAVEQAQQFNREAVAAFDQVLKQCPDHTGALAGKGLSLASLGETAAAVDLFKEALRLDPNNHETLRQLGLCYIELGNLSAARDATSRAVKQANDPEYTESAAIEVYNFAGYIMRAAAAHRDAGRALEERRCYEAAREVFSLSMELHPAEHTRRALEIVNKCLRTN